MYVIYHHFLPSLVDALSSGAWYVQQKSNQRNACILKKNHCNLEIFVADLPVRNS